jgi:hypothetical protein
MIFYRDANRVCVVITFQLLRNASPHTLVWITIDPDLINIVKLHIIWKKRERIFTMGLTFVTVRYLTSPSVGLKCSR